MVRLAVSDEAEKLVNIECSAAAIFRKIPALPWVADPQSKSVNQL
ncbi:hypothetical protein [Arsenophonus endosymbiont of Bemisia tabaci]|nr:hypothetical protein [Arsenophonus endosymbiont of Bemisia tabaci]